LSNGLRCRLCQVTAIRPQTQDGEISLLARNDPVQAHATALVQRALQFAVSIVSARREHLDDPIGRAAAASVIELRAVADCDVWLHDILLLAVLLSGFRQAHIQWRQKRNGAFSVEKRVNLREQTSCDPLMLGMRCGLTDMK